MADLNEVRAGIFVLAALTLLAVGTLWIVGFSPFDGERPAYEVWMKESGGVRSGDRLRVSGIEAGRVQSVELRSGEEWPVRFGVTLDESVRLRVGSTARISSDGMLGAPYLELVDGPPGGEPLPPGSRILGGGAPSFERALEQLGAGADRLPALLEQVAGLLAEMEGEIGPLLDGLQALVSDDNVKAVSGVLARLEPTVDEIVERLSSLAGHLESLAGELEEGLGGVPELTGEVRTLVGDLRRAVGDDGRRVTEVLEAARGTLDSADGVLSTIEGGGRELDAMLRDLRAAAANLRSLSQSLEERPSLLLRSPRAPERTPPEEDR